MATWQPITQLTALYSVLVALLALHWLRRVWLEAREHRVPRLAWVAPFGIAFLLMAPTLELPVLIGIALACLAVSAFWLPAYQRVPPQWRPPVFWGALAVACGLTVMVFSALQVSFIDWTPERIDLLLALGTLSTLVGAANLVIGFGLPKKRPKAVMWLPQNHLSETFALRWQTTLIPEWPELSLTLTHDGAQVRNETGQTLHLLGWSPRHVNAWLLPKDASGRKLNVLSAGQVVMLPLPMQAEGVRIWYKLAESSEHSRREDTAAVRLFSAQWLARPDAEKAKMLN